MSTPAARARMGPDATPLEDENDSDHYFRATQRLTATVARLTERVAALAGSSKMLRGPKCQSQPRVTPSHRTRWRSSRGIDKRSKIL